ncbi:MAG: hypothetical protein L3K17_01450 [Thermoplasmata archaeon]|nr:hypothetical protein [Thermoplasmata archaeon]
MSRAEAPVPSAVDPVRPTVVPAEVEPGNLPGPEMPASSGIAAGIAALLLVVVIVLLVVMVTGYNNSVPYLHPENGNHVVVEGDRVTFSYQFVTNGTMTLSTAGYICDQCPIALVGGQGFALGVNVTNPNKATEEVLRITTSGPFSVISVSPSTSTPIAAGLSEPFTVELTAPGTAGTYIVPLTVSINVG